MTLRRLDRALYIAELYAGDGATTVYLGGIVTPSRRLALRWLRGQALRFADALDPDPYAEWIPPRVLQRVGHTDRDPAGELRAWANSISDQDQALQQLADGLPYQLVTHDDACWYRLDVRPLALPSGATTRTSGIPWNTHPIYPARLSA
ncbi:hypothetical protein ACFUN8_11945 [Streptomyces sp. NPDC057307]|uniref:hypothetical protein n=1 Tax=Streptomyces sp. NPDC057307 TaxID=3346096 RepID=UPI0036294050